MIENDPKEIGISVLKALLRENLPADPENYRLVYNQIFSAESDTAGQALPNAWKETLKNFLQEWDRSQAGLSHLQKIQQRNELFTKEQDAAVFAAMVKLVERWRTLATRGSSGTEEPNENSNAMQQIWVRGLRSGFTVPLKNDSRGQAIIETVDNLLSNHGAPAQDFIQLLRNLWERLDDDEIEKEKVQDIYRRALRLLFSGSAELFTKDPWFSEQLKTLGEAFSTPPATALQAQELLSGLTELLYRQEQRRAPVTDVDRALQELLQLVFQYIETLSEGSSDTYDEFVRISTEIERSDDPKHIRSLVGKLVERSRSLQDMLRDSRDALRQARAQLEGARSRVQDMEEEISQLNLLVHEDPLTHLLNRRGLHLVFERETARAERQKGTLSIALLDLDHFKKINDRFGHETGDEILRHFSGLLRQSLRTEDAIARYGGEEFVVLMPGAVPKLAIQILERLQSTLRTHPLVTTDQQHITVNFSAGIVGWRPATNLESALSAADHALYRAKRDGRQRIYLNDNEQAPGNARST
ncbi:diguanylate cyclase [Acidithiobacillus sp. IBUN Pt1247-S3]|uniref:GGDEF domain-containing protein n=1 Tax=Acidithiobacillus sp. IBUN Pt1247-S3 TaxID=3166642 RepID=UPI0034E6195B